MKRRGVLGLLGGAAVSGPAMAKQAVAQAAAGLEGLSITGIAAGGFGMVPDGTNFGKGVCSDSSEWNEVDWLKGRLTEFLGMSKEDKDDRRNGTYVDRLDPDLAVNRSYSISAKIRIQQDRNFERDMAYDEKQIRRDLTRALLRLD